MSTMLLIRGKLAATMLSEIGKADFLEGLADDVIKMGEEAGDGDNPEVKEVVRLYAWLEKAREEYIILRAEVDAVLKLQGEAEDIP